MKMTGGWRRIQGGEGGVERRGGDGPRRNGVWGGESDVEVTGIPEAKNENVMEGREKETGLRMGGQLE
jgi:hypothetical protein